MRQLIFSFLLLLIFFACKGPAVPVEDTPAGYPTIGSIEVYDSSFYDFVPRGAVIEILAEGFTWSEGPVWVDSMQSVLFSDVPENKVWRWSEKDSLTLYLEPSGYTGTTPRAGEPGSNGLTLDAAGRLVLCQHGDRQVGRMDAPLGAPAPRFTTLAGNFEGKKFNSPNDLAFDRAGNLYFTDPPYGLERNVQDPAKEIPFQGVYRRNVDGSIQLLVDTITRPNGIALSPDEKTLYVANSDPAKAYWLAFDLAADGKLANARVLYDATALVGKEGEAGLPDGFKVSKSGLLFATGPGGVWVLTPQGKALGKIRTLQATANCGFDKQEGALYITADAYLMRVKLK